MGLKEIPVLPEDYPLFDWADWQSSRDALVPGGPTRRFAKECWNAIVDTLADAMSEAGIEWDPGGFEDGRYSYSVEDIKMGKDARLKSSSMNRMIANIGAIAYLGWPWADDPSFRGYTGYGYFAQRPYRLERDKVYPEYIVELVRALNRVLELMRGTWPTTETEASLLVSSLSQPGLDTAPAGRIEAKVPSALNVNPQIELHPSAPIEYGRTVSSKTSAEADLATAVRSSAWVNNPMLFHIQGRVRQALPGNPQDILVHSKVFADVCFSKMAEFLAEWAAASLVQAEVLSREGTATGSEAKTASSAVVDMQQKLPLPTSSQAAAFSKSSVRILRRDPLPTSGEVKTHSSAVVVIGEVQLLDTSTEWESHSNVQAQMEKSVPLPTMGEVTTFSAVTAEAAAVEGMPAGSQLFMSSKAAASIHMGKIQPGWAEKISGSILQISVDQALPAPVGASCRSRSKAICSLGTAWLPPVWVNGGLWIRQAYAVTQNEDGSLEVT